MTHPRVRKFLSYYRPYRDLLAADVVCALIVAAIALVLPIGARTLTQIALADTSPDSFAQLYALGAGMIALVLIQTAANWFVDYQGHVMGARMESDLRAELFAHAQTLSTRFYDDHKTGQLMTRITTDTFAVSELYHHGPEDLIIAILKFAGAFIILLTINVPLTLLMFLFMPVMTVYALHFFRVMMRATRRSYDRIGDINAQVEDSLAGIRVVKSFANEAVEKAKFDRENARFLDARRDVYHAEAWFSAGLLAFTQLMTFAVVILGSAAILGATIDAPDLVAFLLFAAILIDPIQRAINLVRLIQEGVTGFNRVMEIFETQPTIRDAPDAVDLPPVRGEIAFDDVTFRYRDAHPAVLKNVSLTIQPGEFVALIGASGIGKTTLCALIPRFYDVTGGAIRIDGHDIRGVTLRSLRSQIGVVQQDVYLFAGSVADNIRYGRLDASDAEIVAAAKAANAHDFIMALPDGYDTDIGQRGVRLSGGQKQRLSIARVFLKNPPILIFDEATSALDSESERAVQQSVERLARDRTLIVIAHRPSTIQNAQRVIRLTDSGIEEVLPV